MVLDNIRGTTKEKSILFRAFWFFCFLQKKLLFSWEWKEIQWELKKKIIKEDTFKIADIKYVGGIDISFSKVKKNKACVYLSILSFPDLEEVYSVCLNCTLTEPYIPG